MCSYVLYWGQDPRLSGNQPYYKLFDTEKEARDFVLREKIKKYKIVKRDFYHGETNVIENTF